MKLKTLSIAIIAASFSTLTPTAFAWTNDIAQQGNIAYVKDTNGNIVRDSWGRCVRTIDWSKEKATAICEGWPAPAPKKIVAQPAPAPVVKAPVIVEETVIVVVPKPLAFSGFFDNNKTNLTPEAKAKLDEYATFLNANPEKTVAVKGYTDSRGSASYNQQLSQKRANAVKTYLESKGIASDRITAQGLGESNPIADNATQEGRAKNRRVELTISE